MMAARAFPPAHHDYIILSFYINFLAITTRLLHILGSFKYVQFVFVLVSIYFVSPN